MGTFPSHSGQGAIGLKFVIVSVIVSYVISMFVKIECNRCLIKISIKYSETCL